jgi:hypothetical protein
VTPTPRKRVPAKARPTPASDRRANLSLREALDELVQHVRVVARTVDTMAPHELAYAQERLEWLADEVWRIALEGEDAEN